MLVLLLALALLTWTPFFTVYVLYYFYVLRSSRNSEYLYLLDQLLSKSANPVNMPIVTVLIPARNEESTISRKIQNIAELDYDKNKIDVIVVDDYSEDETCERALNALKEFGVQGTIEKNNHRSGSNASYNKGMLKAKGDLILLTDADVTIESDSLKKALTIIEKVKDVGAVTARSLPHAGKQTTTLALENSYNSFYTRMLIGESAIYSTFPGYGGFTLLKKEAFSPIPSDYGSKDGNIALSTLRKGLRYICVPDLVFYEKISQRLRSQIRQKIRRAVRLIQSTLLNCDLAFKKQYGQFGKLIFPLRFAMLTVCPILAFTGAFAVLLSLFHMSTTLGFLSLGSACFLLLLGTRSSSTVLSFFSTFTFHQFYLLLGLVLSPRKMSVWN